MNMLAFDMDVEQPKKFIVNENCSRTGFGTHKNPKPVKHKITPDAIVVSALILNRMRRRQRLCAN